MNHRSIGTGQICVMVIHVLSIDKYAAKTLVPVAFGIYDKLVRAYAIYQSNAKH